MSAELEKKSSVHKGLDELSKMVSLCKRRGFVFQSSEIYGGINACWDYGPMGVELKLNVKRAWWNAMTRRPDIEGLDAAILMAPHGLESSGHVDGFSDPLVDCKKCRNRFRADQIDCNKKLSQLRRGTHGSTKFQSHVQNIHGPC